MRAVASAHPHLALRAFYLAHQAADQGGLAHAVTAHQPDGFARCDVHVHAAQHVAGAVVRGAHFRVGADLGGGAAGDGGAVDHHGDGLGDAEYGVHVVFHQQDRVARLQGVKQVQDAVRLFGAHAGQRLVQQQHLRFARQAHGDLQLALAAVRQQACGAGGVIGQPRAFQCMLRQVRAAPAIRGRAPPETA
ncbi:hypothetical protein G6F68_013554 [Rhizopus microsporus]|nr:hypothetical protein G6F68_013554 [Rhizopus microsporus]